MESPKVYRNLDTFEMYCCRKNKTSYHSSFCFGGRWLDGVREVQGIHGCCKVSIVLGVDDSNVGADFPCSSDVSLRRPLPSPIVNMSLESRLTPFEPGLSSTLMIGAVVPLSTLTTRLSALVVPTFNWLILLAWVVTFFLIRDDEISRTFKNYVEISKPRLA